MDILMAKLRAWIALNDTAAQIIGAVLIWFGVLALAGGSPIGLLLLAAGIFLLVVRSGIKKETKKQTPAQPAPKKECANPEPHRHYEAEKPCPNPEPHRHPTEPARPAPAVRPDPARPLPQTKAQQDAAARKKRLENMRILYDAGLLTKEEYNYEVRRVMNS